jgi:hypothetical protein
MFVQLVHVYMHHVFVRTYILQLYTMLHVCAYCTYISCCCMFVRLVYTYNVRVHKTTGIRMQPITAIDNQSQTRFTQINKSINFTAHPHSRTC